MNQILREAVEKLLKSDERLLDEHSSLNWTLVDDLATKLDESLIALLVSDEQVVKKFFLRVKDVFVFRSNDFKFFLEENKLDNSYTQYKNRIGLAAGKRFLKDSEDVVLNFPYKDCVLEGGQSTEEGMDSYYEWQDTTYKDKLDDEGNKVKEGNRNVKEVDVEAHYEKKQGKRREIFFNQVLAKDEIDRLLDEKALVNWKRFTVDGEQEVGELKRDEDGTIKENLIIKGNNLLALHSLKKQFAGKVKLIYIDPPYNTGNDSFKYNDRFSRATWLAFMRGRLEVAKTLMARDGLIAIQISDKEQAYLKVLIDEVFEGNFRATLVVKMSHLSGVKMAHKGKKVIKTIEYVHVYSKADAPLKLNPQYISTTWEDAFDRHTSYLVKDKSSPDNIQQWKSIPLRKAISQAGVNTRNQEELLKYLISNAHLIFQTAANKNANYPKEPRGVFQEVDGTLILNGREVDFASNKIREIDGVASPVAIVGDIWTDIGINNVFQEGGDDIDLPFGKKPEMLLERLIRTFTEENDLVMDFFAGTGTTACVAHKLSRKWLAVEQLDYIETLTLPRLRNVLEGDKTGVSKSADWQGGGEFIYCELAKWNELAKEAIESSESLAALVTLFDELYEKYFLNYNLRLNEFKEVVMQEEGFKSLSLDEQKEMFLTMLDLNQMYVQKSEMADSKYGITEADQAVTKSFYGENE